jgi:SAM-dependent methyltransferase
MDSQAAAVASGQGACIIGAQLSELGPSHEQTFDAITLSHVIEHVAAPRIMLQDCWRLLKPGGYIWVETPNADSMGYEIYGSNWRGLEVPRHLVLFTADSLRLNLEQAGFERIHILPPVDVTKQLFSASAAMQLDRVAEVDVRPLPAAEFVTAVAYRPSNDLAGKNSDS